MEGTKNAVDATMAGVGLGVLFGWVNAIVGLCVILWYIVRFGEYGYKKIAGKKEKEHHIQVLMAHYKNSRENYDFYPLEELRRLHDVIRHGAVPVKAQQETVERK